jgi:hypothetical protein
MQGFIANFVGTLLLAVLLFPPHLVMGIPVNNNLDSIIFDNSNSIETPQPKEEMVSHTKEPTPSSPFSLLFRSSVPSSVTPKPSKGKKPRRSSVEAALGCQNFVCLLSKFDLLKTDTGYILTPFEDISASMAKKSSKNCKRFDCWLSQFKSTQKSYGWELTYRATPEEEDIVLRSKPGKSSLEPDWPMDIIGDLVITKPAKSSTQSNPQKSPILEFDSLFAKT